MSKQAAFLFASVALGIFGAPVFAAQNAAPEQTLMAAGGYSGLMIAALVCLFCGLARLHKEGQLHLPNEPEASPLFMLACVTLGSAIALLIIVHTGLKHYLLLSVWLFMLFSLIGTGVGLYAAGVRVVRSHP